MNELFNESLRKFEDTLEKCPQEEKEIFYKLATNYINHLSENYSYYLVKPIGMIVKPVGTRAGASTRSTIICPLCSHAIKVTLSP